MRDSSTNTWTYAASAALAIAPDLRRYEVIDGVLLELLSPTSWHQILSRRIQVPLYHFVELAGRGQVFDGPMDVILADTSIVQPDLAVLLRGSNAKVVERGIEGPPDVVVEILSPSTAKIDRSTKRALYARFGVKEYWLVSPELEVIDVATDCATGFSKPVTFHSNDTLRSPTLIEFSLALSEVFKEPIPL